MSKDSTKSGQNTIIQINEEQIKDHLGEMVRGKVVSSAVARRKGVRRRPRAIVRVFMERILTRF